MKKLIFVSLSIALVLSANAQKKTQTKPAPDLKTKIAIKAGANMSTARVYQNDVKQGSDFVPGYGIAVLFRVPFEGALYFNPHLAYNRRGYKYTPTSGSITEYQNTIHYFDMVPNLGVYLPVGKNLFAISGGPHLSIALAGTEKTSTRNSSSSSKMKFSFDSDYGYVDMGLGGSVGFHTKSFFIEAALQYGLTNINNNYEIDYRNIRNRMISFNIGYYLK